jgi:hypothetical protein
VTELEPIPPPIRETPQGRGRSAAALAELGRVKGAFAQATADEARTSVKKLLSVPARDAHDRAHARLVVCAQNLANLTFESQAIPLRDPVAPLPDELLTFLAQLSQALEKHGIEAPPLPRPATTQVIHPASAEPVRDLAHEQVLKERRHARNGITPNFANPQSDAHQAWLNLQGDTP